MSSLSYADDLALAEEERADLGQDGVPGTSSAVAEGQGHSQSRKALPEQRRRVMSDRFMMFTYKIKLCKRQDPHNWRLCPYAHPGEAGKRRPPHAYQAVMCDFSKTRKECSHGEACLLARNALEYWLHPSKYRTILCGHGEACNRNICFFAHNQQELRTPAARSGVMEPSADAAAEALQQLSLGHPGAGSSSQAGQQLLYMRDPSGMATVAYQHASGSSGSSRLGGLQQPMQAVHIMGPGVAQQQVLVQVAPEEQQQQQLPIVVSAAGGDVRAAAGMQHMQAGTGGPPGIVAAALQQPPEMVVAQPFIQRQPQQLLQQPGYMYHEGLQQAQHPYHEALQQAQQLQQHHQRGAVAQSVEGGPLVHASAPADSTHRGPLLLQQQLMMPAQGWGEVAAAGQFQGIVQEGGGMSHMSYYAVPMPPGALQGQMVVPAAHNNPQQQPQMLHLQQPQPPQQQQQQHAYYHQQPQLVVYAAGNPAAAAGRSSSAMSFVPANPGPGQMQLLLSQQPGVQPGMQPGSGIVQVHAPPVAGIEQPGAYVPRSATDMAEPAAHYGLPQTGKW